MAQVVLQQVAKTFHHQPVVKGLDLVVPDGSFTVLVGPSGCGKSTTLRMIAGLESASQGDIWIGGQRVNELPPGKRDVAMVFQNYALYPTMTVFDNIAFGLRNRGIAKKECKRMVEEIAAVVGLSGYLQRMPSQLSGGQRQRVALGRAMVKQPQVFLMDEPLSNLDAKLRNQMRVELSSLHRQLSSTFIYVTHDQVEAMTMGDQIVVMNEGRIMQVASPLDLYHDPANLFVAQFIGSPAMNILPAAEAGKLLGFRPEKAVMLPAAVQSLVPESALVLRGTVVSREVLGSDVLYHVKVPSGSVIVKKDPESLLETAAEVQIAVPVECIYLFDQATGERIPARAEQMPRRFLAGGMS
ncbi:ABC transporter ATP-binding protein [Brevibacillus massiliensis]|uniref:ABC transporter ATP-binding protein n=1 Tax=Brevibacillus massiliensis TaxID=1118054 RepID=UPI0003021B0E|nr:ABC transporter ATP-binding protein [Brevibacillus massiliensis]